jgi:hypothetical protein
LAEASKLAGLIIAALEQAAARPIAQATKMSTTPSEDLVAALHRIFAPRLAQVVSLSERLRANHNRDKEKSA